MPMFLGGGGVGPRPSYQTKPKPNQTTRNQTNLKIRWQTPWWATRSGAASRVGNGSGSRWPASCWDIPPKSCLRTRCVDACVLSVSIYM